MNPLNESPADGLLVVDKTEGPTSHDIVYRARRILRTKRIGHTGTLDPFASGLLLLCIGRGTRLSRFFQSEDKKYRGTISFGQATDTYDRTGKPASEKQAVALCEETVRSIFDEFTGEISLLPPMYSAKKVGGKKLYELARKGEEIEREPNKIIIHQIELLNYNWPTLEIRTVCSSGTYIRSLAHDIGQSLGTGAYLEKLKRTKIGEHKLKDAIDLDKIDQTNWQNLIK